MGGALFHYHVIMGFHSGWNSFVILLKKTTGIVKDFYLDCSNKWEKYSPLSQKGSVSLCFNRAQMCVIVFPLPLARHVMIQVNTLFIWIS